MILKVVKDARFGYYHIRLPREKLKALKLKAVEEGKSVSQLIRERP
jgi:hypothetical protein